MTARRILSIFMLSFCGLVCKSITPGVGNYNRNPDLFDRTAKTWNIIGHASFDSTQLNVMISTSLNSTELSTIEKRTVVFQREGRLTGSEAARFAPPGERLQWGIDKKSVVETCNDKDCFTVRFLPLRPGDKNANEVRAAHDSAQRELHSRSCHRVLLEKSIYPRLLTNLSRIFLIASIAVRFPPSTRVRSTCIWCRGYATS